MVHLGMGGAFLPSYGIAEDVKEGKFKRIEILDDLFLYIDVIYLKERKKSKTIQSFVSAATGYAFPYNLCMRSQVQGSPFRVMLF